MRSATLALLLILQAAFANAALAGDDRLLWHMVQATGDVSATSGSILAVALDPKAPLPDGAVISTGANGRAILKRGGEQIALGPSSRIVLGSGELFTRIRQDAGSALFSVGKRTAPHFEVDAPFLAAIVKGTVFTVTVDKTGSSVAVTQGAVEVATDGRSAVTLVKPGTTARVSREASSQIDLVNGGRVSRTVTGYDDGWPAGKGPSAPASTGAPELRQSDAARDFTSRSLAATAVTDARPHNAAGTTIHFEQDTSAPQSGVTGTTVGDGSRSGATTSNAAWLTNASVDATPLLRAQTYDQPAPSGSAPLLLGPGYNIAQGGTATIYTASRTVGDATALATRNAGEILTKVQRTAGQKLSNVRSEVPVREILFGLGALIVYMIANQMLGLRRRLKASRSK